MSLVAVDSDPPCKICALQGYHKMACCIPKAPSIRIRKIAGPSQPRIKKPVRENNGVPGPMIPRQRRPRRVLNSEPSSGRSPLSTTDATHNQNKRRSSGKAKGQDVAPLKKRAMAEAPVTRRQKLISTIKKIKTKLQPFSTSRKQKYTMSPIPEDLDPEELQFERHIGWRCISMFKKGKPSYDNLPGCFKGEYFEDLPLEFRDLIWPAGKRNSLWDDLVERYEMGNLDYEYVAVPSRPLPPNSHKLKLKEKETYVWKARWPQGTKGDFRATLMRRLEMVVPWCCYCDAELVWMGDHVVACDHVEGDEKRAVEEERFRSMNRPKSFEAENTQDAELPSEHIITGTSPEESDIPPTPSPPSVFDENVVMLAELRRVSSFSLEQSCPDTYMDFSSGQIINPELAAGLGASLQIEDMPVGSVLQSCTSLDEMMATSSQPISIPNSGKPSGK